MLGYANIFVGDWRGADLVSAPMIAQKLKNQRLGMNHQHPAVIGDLAPVCVSSKFPQLSLT